MFYHRNLATHGLFPGVTTHRSVANLGHYEVEIIIRPVTGGGGGGTKWLTPIKDREIIIRVTKDGETWEASYVTSKYFADPIVKVTAWLRGFRSLMESINVSARKLRVRIQEIFVKGRKL